MRACRDASDGVDAARATRPACRSLSAACPSRAHHQRDAPDHSPPANKQSSSRRRQWKTFQTAATATAAAAPTTSARDVRGSNAQCAAAASTTGRSAAERITVSAAPRSQIGREPPELEGDDRRRPSRVRDRRLMGPRPHRVPFPERDHRPPAHPRRRQRRENGHRHRSRATWRSPQRPARPPTTDAEPHSG